MNYSKAVSFSSVSHTTVNTPRRDLLQLNEVEDLRTTDCNKPPTSKPCIVSFIGAIKMCSETFPGAGTSPHEQASTDGKAQPIGAPLHTCQTAHHWLAALHLTCVYMVRNSVMFRVSVNSVCDEQQGPLLEVRSTARATELGLERVELPLHPCRLK